MRDGGVAQKSKAGDLCVGFILNVILCPQDQMFSQFCDITCFTFLFDLGRVPIRQKPQPFLHKEMVIKPHRQPPKATLTHSPSLKAEGWDTAPRIP